MMGGGMGGGNVHFTVNGMPADFGGMPGGGRSQGRGGRSGGR